MKIFYTVLDENALFADCERFAGELPAERREKIARYKFDKDKLRSLAAGLMIRRFAGEGELIYGEHEKPYLKDGGVFFSVSHSGDIVAIAVDGKEIGCDVEMLPADNRLKIADRFFHPNERDYVRSSENRNLAFCRIWTRKEAYLKMTGEGISTDLTAFDTTSEPLTKQLFTADKGGRCLSVCSVEPIDETEIFISQKDLKDII